MFSPRSVYGFEYLWVVELVRHPVFVTSLVAGLCTILLSLVLKRRSYPTPVPGLPLLGNAVALGKHGVSYIRACRQQYGDTFTLNLASQRMVFLFGHSHIEAFFKAPDSEITFRPAVEQFTQRVFGLPSKEFFPRHSDVLVALRHLLVPAALKQHAAQLAELAQQQLSRWPTGKKVDLYPLVQGLVFRSALQVLFGPAFVGAHDLEALQRAFFEFEEGFELAASPVPHIFQRRFLAARAHLLAAFKASCAAGHLQGTVVGQLMQGSGLRAPLLPNLLLALVWASQANTVPATFWALAFLLLPENAAHKERLQQQLQQGQAQGQQQLAPQQQESQRGKKEQGAAAGPTSPRRARGGVTSPRRRRRGSGKALDAATPAAEELVGRAAAGMSPGRLTRSAAKKLPQRLQTQQGTEAAAAAAAGPPHHLPHPLTTNAAHPPSSSSSSATTQLAIQLALDKRSHASRCVAEAIRLRLQSIDIRIAASDLALPSSSGTTASIPRGSILAICPFESHHDSELYGSSAWSFDPCRAGFALGDGTAVVPGVAGLAFGGGFYRCPGRFFAEMEIALLVQLVLQHCSVELCGSTQGSRGAARGGAEASGGGTGRGVFGWRDVLRWGLGSGLQVEGWRSSGDAGELLPRCNLQHLVGVKVPAEPCLVVVQRR